MVPMTNPVADRRTTGTSSVARTEERGTRVKQALSMGIMRCAIVAGSTSLVSALTFKGSAGTAMDGVPALLLTVAIAGLWSALDAWRQSLAEPVIAWSLASVLLVAAAPLTLTLSYQHGEDGWTGPGAFVAAVWDSAGFVLALTAVPAAIGLAVGRLIRKSRATHPRE